MSTTQASTFTMEVAFLSKVPDTDPQNLGGFKDEIVKKTATFQELDRRSKEQRPLHALIISVCTSVNTTGSGKIKLTRIDKNLLSEFVETFVEEMLIPNAVFSEQDKEELLLDGPNLILLGYDLVSEKAFPFFASIRPTSTPPEGAHKKRSKG